MREGLRRLSMDTDTNTGSMDGLCEDAGRTAVCGRPPETIEGGRRTGLPDHVSSSPCDCVPMRRVCLVWGSRSSCCVRELRARRDATDADDASAEGRQCFSDVVCRRVCSLITQCGCSISLNVYVFSGSVAVLSSWHQSQRLGQNVPVPQLWPLSRSNGRATCLV